MPSTKKKKKRIFQFFSKLNIQDINLLYAYCSFLSLLPVSLCPSGSDVLWGDGLVLISAALYAVSNVCQEYTVKNLSRVEFLGMMGLFGTLISGVQM